MSRAIVDARFRSLECKLEELEGRLIDLENKVIFLHSNGAEPEVAKPAKSRKRKEETG